MADSTASIICLSPSEIIVCTAEQTFSPRTTGRSVERSQMKVGLLWFGRIPYTQSQDLFSASTPTMKVRGRPLELVLKVVSSWKTSGYRRGFFRSSKEMTQKHPPNIK
jgi:hypothetical protein